MQTPWFKSSLSFRSTCFRVIPFAVGFLFWLYAGENKMVGLCLSGGLALGVLVLAGTLGGFQSKRSAFLTWTLFYLILLLGLFLVIGMDKMNLERRIELPSFSILLACLHVFYAKHYNVGTPPTL